MQDHVDLRAELLINARNQRFDRCDHVFRDMMGFEQRLLRKRAHSALHRFLGPFRFWFEGLLQQASEFARYGVFDHFRGYLL